MNMEAVQIESDRILKQWFAEIRGETGANRVGALFGGIAALEAALESFPIDESALVTENNQVRNIKSRVDRVMSRYDEARKLPTERGRTTRSTAIRARLLAGHLNATTLFHEIDEVARRQALDAMVAKLVDEVRKYLDQEIIRVQIDLSKSGAQIVEAILDAAQWRKLGGPVAQHLVGAKLQRRFPHKQIENLSATAADEQTGRSGDFQVGRAVFHVTVHVQEGVVQKCLGNLVAGLVPFLLVPDRQLAAARQLVELSGGTGRIDVSTSIEAFVGQNLEELGEFARDGLRTEFRKLLQLYNQRVGEVESNPALRIDIPENLQG